MITKQTVLNELTRHESHSAWMHGVVAYAVNMLNSISDHDFAYLVYYAQQEGEDGIEKARAILHTPYDNWRNYSRLNGWLSDEAIATLLCTPEELKRFDGGKLPPNGRSTWIDIQTRAMYNAACLIVATVQGLKEVE